MQILRVSKFSQNEHSMYSKTSFQSLVTPASSHASPARVTTVLPPIRSLLVS